MVVQILCDDSAFFWLQSSQQSILMDDKSEVSYDQSLESSQQARIARSLQAHDYVSVSLHILVSARQVID